MQIGFQFISNKKWEVQLDLDDWHKPFLTLYFKCIFELVSYLIKNHDKEFFNLLWNGEMVEYRARVSPTELKVLYLDFESASYCVSQEYFYSLTHAKEKYKYAGSLCGEILGYNPHAAVEKFILNKGKN